MRDRAGLADVSWIGKLDLKGTGPEHRSGLASSERAPGTWALSHYLVTCESGRIPAELRLPGQSVRYCDGCDFGLCGPAAGRSAQPAGAEEADLAQRLGRGASRAWLRAGFAGTCPCRHFAPRSGRGAGFPAPGEPRIRRELLGGGDACRRRVRAAAVRTGGTAELRF